MDDVDRQSGEMKVSRKLAEDLQELYGAKGTVPARVDLAVAAMARRQLSRGRAPWRKWALAGVSAAAAAVLLLLMINLEQGEPGDGAGLRIVAGQGTAGHREDIDGSGRVDMLDALKMARMIESGRTNMKLDLNGDGVVDKRDVDVVAYTAVRLGKGA